MADKVLDCLEITEDRENDTLTIHAPENVRVVHRSTNDYTDGVTIIFELRRPYVL